ncbi:hypothetical protein [Streptomyces sp. 061-3]|uniref:hypothetical protein n=1 Tax=Streptomyces sp. 061-3 TaxID=2789268 RepID=UPI0039803049
MSHELGPLLHKLGLPSSLTVAIAFVVAVIVVVFRHLVAGEMAPQALGHLAPRALRDPPLAAFRGVVKVVRPLIWLTAGSRPPAQPWRAHDGHLKSCRHMPYQDTATPPCVARTGAP